MNKEDLLEELFDLKHDLGKYIRLPLAMLPPQADDAQVRIAVKEGLQRTRVHADRVRSAVCIWQDFLSKIESADALKKSDGFSQLSKAVQKALDWEQVVTDGNASLAIDRYAIQQDLDSVTRAITELIDGINHVS